MRLGLYSKKRKMAFVSFFMTFALFIGLLSVPTVKTRASEDMVYRLLTNGGVKAGDEIVLVYPVTKNSGGESKEYMRTLYSTGRNGMVDIVNGERLGGTDPLFKLTDRNPQINQVWTVEESDGVFALKNVNHENQTKYLDLTVAGSTRAMTAGEFKGLNIEQVSGKAGRFHVKSDSFALVYDIRGLDRGHFKALAATSLPAESEILIYKKSPRVVEESTEPSVPGEGEPTIPELPAQTEEIASIHPAGSVNQDEGKVLWDIRYENEKLIEVVNEFTLNTSGTFVEGEKYAVVYRDSKNQSRILFCYPSNHEKKAFTDVVNGDINSNQGLELNSGFSEENQFWVIKKVSDNTYGLKSHYWLDLGRDSAIKVHTTETAKEVTFVKDNVNEGLYKIKLGERYLSYSDTSNTFKTGAANESISVYLYRKSLVERVRPFESKTSINLPEAPAGSHLSGQTVGQPFINGETATSRNFRIPAMVTLSSGRIVAAADARWHQGMDADGIDIVVSRSDDHGATWKYDTPLHFNDSPDGGNHSYMQYSATIMDAALTKDHKDNLYLLVDIFPGGIALNTAPMKPEFVSGYREIDGVQRLVLYYGYRPEQQDDDNWNFYVGDFVEKDGSKFAPVYAKGDASVVKYYIDDGYYLYNENYEALYCSQLGAEKTYKIRQNVFFYNADIHVRAATYLALSKSTDGGKTWTKPEILNPQILAPNIEMSFYGVGPGTGITLKDGTIMIPVYKYNGRYNQRSSFIYSTDGGNTWKRSEDTTKSSNNWSSESVLVEIDENTVRHFLRHEYSSGYRGFLRYVDFKKNGERWIPGEAVDVLEAPIDVDCQLSAIRLERSIGGKPVIMVSAPGTHRRRNGKIFTFIVEENGAMKKVADYAIISTDRVGNNFAYSCLTEQKDGKIGILLEDGRGLERITYMNFDLETLVPNVKFDETTPQTEPGQSGSQSGSEGSEQTPGQSGSQSGSEGSEQTPGQSGNQNGSEGSEQTPGQGGSQSGSEGSEQTPGQSGSQNGSEGSEQTPGQSGSQNGSEGSEQTPGQSGSQNGSEGSEQTPGQSGSQNGSEGSEQTPNQNGNQGASPAPQENQNNYVPYIPYFPIEPAITLEEADKKTTIAVDVKEKKSEEKSEEKELSEIKVEEDKTPQGSANLSSSKDKIAMIRETKEYRNLTKDNPKRLVAVAKTLDEAEEAKTSFVSKSGEVLRDTFIQLGKNHFYLDSKGELAENRLIVTYQEDSNKVKTYYAGKNGVLVKNGFVTLKKGTKAYFDKNGEMVKNKVITVKGKKYFFSKDGKMVTGKVITIKGKLYQITKSGVMKKKK